ncbi:hypothetical protein F7725_025487 [Dissostichus mawsoni]|uniref:RHD domain-containing protein n=1 Tax=Dissostichus mawsoni TaxID=36200 RepID=A0A7J5XBR8_DISMA|nr:hypothetical protein F7725_025487 [Dissostichus mawsoni]
MGNPCLPSQYLSLKSGPTISVSITEPHSYDSQEDMRAGGYYSSSSVRPNGAPTLESPRIEITAYGQFPEDEVEETNLPVAKRVNSISSFSYNYDNSPQNSPWQSPSVSPKGSTLTLPGDGFTSGGSPRNSPSTSPRTSVTDDTWMGQRGSRPNSPCGAKRKYSFNGNGPAHKQYPYSPNHSPGLSPQTSPRLSITEESWLPNTNQYTNSAILAAINALTTDGVTDLGEGIPIKARKTSLEHSPTISLKLEPGGEELIPGELGLDEQRMPLKKEGYCGGFLDVPQHPYSWSKPKQYVSPSLPALDWQLPSSSGPYSLKVDMQPKSHHRAHYETEGSRGAVKALAGGHPVVQVCLTRASLSCDVFKQSSIYLKHSIFVFGLPYEASYCRINILAGLTLTDGGSVYGPVVLHGYMESEPLTLQLFIGTADDRLLRPHAFYQVHRITGKTVSTPSHEALHTNTKILEIPLLPENNMRAIIDCAGILKLRNSDIELRKGETDIGRKNTRVRMVCMGSGCVLLNAEASLPPPTAQRSAQELPLVDKRSLETCPALGGERMRIDGHNFQHDSKVVFVEKAQDGHHLWETEAKVDRDVSKANSLLIEVPPYRNQRLSTPVHVNFYVCNGKRKRSQYQRFTYVPANVPTIKTEPHDDYDGPLVHQKPYFPSQVMTPMVTSDLRPCVVGGAYSVSQQRLAAKPSSLPPSSSPSPKLHDLSLPPFSKCLPGGPALQPPGQQSPVPHVSIIQETPGATSPPSSTLPAVAPPLLLLLPPTSQASTPTDGPFSPALCLTPAPQPGSGNTSPAAQQHPKVPQRGRGSLQEDGSPPPLAVSIKQEPQELDQMYLDDGQ